MPIINEEQVISNFSKAPLKARVLRMVTHKSLKESKICLFREVTDMYELQDLTITNIVQTMTLSSAEAKLSHSGLHRLGTTAEGA